MKLGFLQTLNVSFSQTGPSFCVINKSRSIIIVSRVSNEKWAKRFNSVHKASCLKQNQKWGQMKCIVTVNKKLQTIDQGFYAISALISAASPAQNG